MYLPCGRVQQCTCIFTVEIHAEKLGGYAWLRAGPPGQRPHRGSRAVAGGPCEVERIASGRQDYRRNHPKVKNAGCIPVLTVLSGSWLAQDGLSEVPLL